MGTQTAVTDSRGYFSITDAAPDKKTSLLTVDMQGYFKAFRSLMATTGVNEVVIRPFKKDLSGTVDASAGGSVSLFNGSVISLPAGGFNRG